MKSTGLDFQDLLQIVDVIRSSSQFSEVRVRSGDIEIELRRGPAKPNGAHAAGHVEQPSPRAAAPQALAAPAPAAAPAHAAHVQRHGHVGGGELVTDSPAAKAASATHHPAVREFGPEALVVRSPMVGTFYRAPEPGAAPFVDVGQAVAPDTTVCIIEVMKLMTSLPAGLRGRVAEILVADGEAVEHGQPLIVLEPLA